ncbi:MAG TPA: BatA and WFA domain-containing protein, partial [Isosphaeraceae bacterium]|nr:BatA and WFA domain-containing protein [Isosphaeraceae bacterium]
MDISLLHAGLAAGAALAALPVILHLFMKQTPKHVIFPALRLIRERHKRSRKKLRIKNWLLLLARMAVLALMALALARPALNAQANLGDREVPTALALVFDTSLSMEYTERNTTRLAEAKQRAEDILKKTPGTSQVFVVDSAEPGAPLPMSPAAAKKRIDSLALRPVNRPLNAALGQAYRAVAESDRPRREVYVLTDLERTSWDLGRPVEGLDVIRKVKSGVSTFVLRLTPKDVRDVGVVAALATSGVASQGEPIEVKAQLRSSGPATTRLVEFFVDKDAKGRPIKRAQKQVELPADGEVEVVFKTPTLGIGLHQGEVSIAGTDPMEFDDHRYFSLQVQPALKVLVVSDYKIDAEFVTMALDPSKLRTSSARPYRVDRVNADQLSGHVKDTLKEYACIFLLNVRRLEDSDWSRLNGFVREGGGLVVALGHRADPQNYNTLIAGQVVPASADKVVHPKEPTYFGKA